MILPSFRRRKVLNIGGPRFKILVGGGGGQGGGGGGANFSLAVNRSEPLTPSQCHIITFLTLKTDNIAKLRIELKCVLLQIPSNKIKGKYIKLVHL